METIQPAPLPVLATSGDPGFLREQYGRLREEMASRVSQRESNERLALTAAAAYWAWLSTHLDISVPGLAFWVPSGIVLILGFKALAIDLGIGHLKDFLAELESAFNAGVGAWEQRLAKRHWRWYPTFVVFYWSMLLLSNIFLAFFAAAGP